MGGGAEIHGVGHFTPKSGGVKLPFLRWNEKTWCNCCWWFWGNSPLILHSWGGVVSYNDPLVKIFGISGIPARSLQKCLGRCQGHVGTQHRHMVWVYGCYVFIPRSQSKKAWQLRKISTEPRGRGAAWSHAAPPARRRRPGLRPRWTNQPLAVGGC